MERENDVTMLWSQIIKIKAFSYFKTKKRVLKFKQLVQGQTTKEIFIFATQVCPNRKQYYLIMLAWENTANI